jgi:hypothetical protein
MEDKEFQRLRRKRSTVRGNVTRFTAHITEFTYDTSLDDYDHYRGRLKENLDQLVPLDDKIQGLLEDDKYTEDVSKSAEYIDAAKRVIRKAARVIKKRLSSPEMKINRAEDTYSSTTPWPLLAHLVKLPPIKLEPFAGDVEAWSRFWQQFESSKDKDPILPAIRKQVLFRGYLEGEPKMLVDGIAVTANTYEETKKILHARYGEKNCIIQGHLDYLEEIQFPSAEELNTTYIKCNRRIQALCALGQDVSEYGGVLAPNKPRVFPDDICRRWIIHVKREGHSERDIVKLTELLSEEADGILTTQTIRGETSRTSIFLPTTAALHVDSKHWKTTQMVKEST